MAFQVYEPLPGVMHIRDALNVCCTLLTGTKSALLIDAGYGLEDLGAQVRALTPLPLTLWLTHAHHDHALGARWFALARMCAPERPVWDRYTSRAWRERVLASAPAELAADREAYLAARMAAPVFLDGEALDLGGLTARVIPCPGHTPGSAVVWVPQRRLLLTGDDWNPVTWLFFEEALPVRAWRENLRGILRLPFEYVLCPHRAELYPRDAVEAFVDAITDDAIHNAVPDESGTAYGIRTRAVALPGGARLVFADDARNSV